MSPVKNSSGACRKSDGMVPVTSGFVGDNAVETLRDSGSRVVVRRDLVNEDQMLSQVETCILLDGSVLTVPMARIDVDTPYLTGNVIAMCMECPIYVLVVGNVQDARQPQDPYPDWWSRVASGHDVQSNRCEISRDVDKVSNKVYNEAKFDKPDMDVEVPAVKVSSQNIDNIDIEASVVLTRSACKKLEKPLKPLFVT